MERRVELKVNRETCRIGSKKKIWAELKIERKKDRPKVNKLRERERENKMLSLNKTLERKVRRKNRIKRKEKKKIIYERMREGGESKKKRDTGK